MDSSISFNFLSQLMFEKLSHKNYFTWKRQIMSFIKCHGIKGHLVETLPALQIAVLRVVIDGNEKNFETEVRNPDYIAWKKRDQSLIAYIFATLSKVIYTISDTYAKDIWDMFARNYS